MKTMSAIRRILTAVSVALAITACHCKSCTAAGSNKMMQKPQYVIDVRNPDEYANGHLSGAILIPYTEIEAKIQSVVADRKSSVALYCRTGRRSGIAKETMERMGYGNVVNLGSVEDAAKTLNLTISPERPRPDLQEVY